MNTKQWHGESQNSQPLAAGYYSRRQLRPSRTAKQLTEKGSILIRIPQQTRFSGSPTHHHQKRAKNTYCVLCDELDKVLLVTVARVVDGFGASGLAEFDGKGSPGPGLEIPTDISLAVVSILGDHSVQVLVQLSDLVIFVGSNNLEGGRRLIRGRDSDLIDGSAVPAKTPSVDSLIFSIDTSPSKGLLVTILGVLDTKSGPRLIQVQVGGMITELGSILVDKVDIVLE
ncbi:MAG: hypothetical protein J3Q66DRAFT_366575 [Benniella sp.]|nr:MAG: hypothetical protein J3Q66DRAFT_366575 [Benniella sp.]